MANIHRTLVGYCRSTRDGKVTREKRGKQGKIQKKMF